MNTVNGVMLTCLQMHRAILSMVQVNNGGNKKRLLIIDSYPWRQKFTRYAPPILGMVASKMDQIYLYGADLYPLNGNSHLHQCQCVIFLIKTCVLPQTQSS